MEDKLKQFIDDNREDFDSESPSSKLLARIKRDLGHGRETKKFLALGFMQWAAVVVGLVILSIVLYYSMQKPGNNPIVKNTDKIDESELVAEPVYAKQIDQYQMLISLQQTELRKVEKEQPELYRQFAKDMNQLDSAYHALKQTLTDNPNREMLLEAMISNLQLQSELLNRQLLIIKEIKQKSKAHEKNSV